MATVYTLSCLRNVPGHTRVLWLLCQRSTHVFVHLETVETEPDTIEAKTSVQSNKQVRHLEEGGHDQL